MMNRSKRKERQYKQKFNPDFNPVDQGKPRPEVVVEPLNQVQAEYIQSLLHCPCTLVTGSAGTGKTYLAASIAAQSLSNRTTGSIIISRPNVPTGKSLGAFPGTVEEKMAPWLIPITSTLRKHLGDSFYDECFKRGQIQIQPIETIRGQSFDNAIILFDESQQLEIDEIKAIVTRIGKYSRLVLMGDTTQRDNTASGLEYLYDIATRHDLPVALHHFTSDDIVRSNICQLFVKAFEEEES